MGGWEPRHLSFSTLSGYRDCGKRTFFQKVKGLEQRPGLAALAGNALHSASEEIDALIQKHGWGILDQEDGSDEPAPF